MIRGTIIAFLGNALLWTIQSQLNHYLGPWDLTLFLGGLSVAFAALRLPAREGARVTFLTGLWHDAAAPVPFGLHAFLFLLAFTIIVSIRGRIAREETLVGLLIAALANLAFLIAVSAALIHRNPAPFQVWPRLVADSLASFCVIILIGPWFFAFQEGFLGVFGVSLRRDATRIA